MEDLRFWPKGLVPREGQLEVAEKLEELLKNNKRIILNAPTGWGKTLVTLVALKNSGKIPVIWLVRSLSIGERILEDVRKVSLHGFIAGGRDKTCLYKKYRNNIDILYFCRYSRFKCPFFLGLNKFQFNENVHSYKELVKIGKKYIFCPYYAQETYIYRSDVIVQNYYRKRPKVFSSLVIDEAHNILAPREIKIPAVGLLNALNELLRSNLSKRTKKQVEYFLRFITVNNSEWDLASFFDLDALDEIESIYLNKIINGIETEIGHYIKLYGSIIAYRENDYYSVIKLGKRFEWKPIIYISGTFLKPFKDFLEIDNEIRVLRRRKLNGYILSWVTTKYGVLEKNLREYEKILTTLKLLDKVVVFTSERIISRVKRYATMIEEELHIFPSKWRGILLLKSRGKFSEGVDINSDAVMILGAPYLTPNVISKLLYIYRKMGYSNAKKLSSDIPMLVTTLQCIGRVFRSPDSNPLVILADYRFSLFKDSLNEYLELEEVNSLSDFRKIILRYKSMKTKL